MKRGNPTRRSIKKHDIEQDRKFSRKKIPTYAVVAATGLGLGLGGIIMYNLYGKYGGGEKSTEEPVENNDNEKRDEPSKSKDVAEDKENNELSGSPEVSNRMKKHLGEDSSHSSTESVQTIAAEQEESAEINNDNSQSEELNKFDKIKECIGNDKIIEKLTQYDTLFTQVENKRLIDTLVNLFSEDPLDALLGLIKKEKNVIKAKRSQLLGLEETTSEDPGDYEASIEPFYIQGTWAHILKVSKKMSFDKVIEELYILDKVKNYLAPQYRYRLYKIENTDKYVLDIFFYPFGEELVRLSDTESVVKLFINDDHHKELENIKKEQDEETFGNNERHEIFAKCIQENALKLEKKINEKIRSIRTVFRDFHGGNLSDILTNGNDIIFTEYDITNENKEDVSLRDVKNYIKLTAK